MCVDPITGIAMGLSAAQGAAQYSAQKQAAEQQERAQKAASEREIQRQQMAMRSERMQQADEETTMAREQLKADREAQEAISTTTTAAEAVNVAGTSVGLSIQDFEVKNAEYQAALALQERMNDTARRLSLENSGQQFVTRMGDINQPIAQPDFLGTALGTASNMLSSYQSGEALRMQRSNAALQEGLYSAQTTVAKQGLAIGEARLRNLGLQAESARAATATAQSQARLFDAQRLMLGGN